MYNKKEYNELQNKRNFFDERASSWDVLYNPQILQRIHSIFNQYLNCLEPPLLDLGSGTGILIPEIKNRFSDKDFLVVEADISKTMLKEAVNHHQSDGVLYTQADGHNLPFKDKEFNSIVCFQVFPHFHDKLRVMPELQRILKPHGYLVILHLMGHKELNAMHKTTGNAVKKDKIIPAEKLARQLSGFFSIEYIAEQMDLYLIIAKKTADELAT